LLKKFPGPYPAPNDLTASAHRADFKLRFNGPYADTTGDVKRFDSLDEKAIAQLLAKPNKAAQPFSFAAKKDIEGRIFVLRTDKGLPVKMMFRVTSENKTKWKRNAVLELWYVVYRH
ncbi:MAG: hypothetical protein JW829_15330, partial [Pirellulales bacterium]|nr:hypothetical protein [Pirellulales bacterium]